MKQRIGRLGLIAGDDLRLMPGARILVAERSEQHARQVGEYLEAAGYLVYMATDGGEALRSIRRDDPELALLDVGIGRVNAYQLCERIKNHPPTRTSPVLMLVSP